MSGRRSFIACRYSFPNIAMPRPRRPVWYLVCALAVALGAPTIATPAFADLVRIAVASNFNEPAREISRLFEQATGHTVSMSTGSTGQLYAQITQDAPFEVFLAADQLRPEAAVAEGYAVDGTRFTYATGRLALFSTQPALVRDASTLHTTSFTRIAIANPATAPYGAAAVAVLKALGVYAAVEARIVYGSNIAQTFQFVATNNAELGFVALSQIAGHRRGSRWVVPQDLHPPIAQDAVLLQRGASSDAARAFVAFLQGPQAAAVKARYGYDHID